MIKLLTYIDHWYIYLYYGRYRKATWYLPERQTLHLHDAAIYATVTPYLKIIIINKNETCIVKYLNLIFYIFYFNINPINIYIIVSYFKVNIKINSLYTF